MDIRSIIDTETSDAALAKTVSRQRTTAIPVYQQQQQPPYPPAAPRLRSPYEALSSAHTGQRESRPPQPPPLQPPIYNDLRSPGGSSHNSAQSPYQHTPSSTHSGGQYPFPQHPTQGSTHGIQTSPSAQREGHMASIGTSYQSYGQQTPVSQKPTVTTPTGSHASPHPSRQTSTQFVSTPTSAQNQLPNVFRDSPQASQFQSRSFSQSQSSQHYLSQPGTLLGPPSVFARPTSNLVKESPESYEHQRNLSAGSYGQSQPITPSPKAEPPVTSAIPLLAPESQQSFSRTQSYQKRYERKRSLSVSPKTKLPGESSVRQPEGLLMERRIDQATHVMTSANHITSEEKSGVIGPQEQTDFYNSKRTRPVEMKTLINAPPVRDVMNNAKEPLMITPKGCLFKAAEPEESDSATGSAVSNISTSTMPKTPSIPELYASRNSSVISMNVSSEKSSTQQITSSPKISRSEAVSKSSLPPQPSLVLASSTQYDTTKQQPLNQEVLGALKPLISSEPQPVKKRVRYAVPPVYAQSARTAKRSASGHPVSSNKRQLPGQPIQQTPATLTPMPAAAPLRAHNPPSTSQVKQITNGHPIPGGHTVRPQSNIAGSAFSIPGVCNTLGPIPFEEVTRVVSDFLYQEVVGRDDVGAGPLGGGSSKGAIIEIEAKIGQLIDKTTNERLRLPITTECVLDKHDPTLRVAFKSSMTEAQHRSLNGFLNTALVKSQAPKDTSPPSQSYVPMSYVHTYECDTFYELSQSGALILPASIRSQLNPRHSKAKVRITTDQKTGKELAKIVKVRINDLDVYSPRTAFDWRISVNLEMNFEGDMQAFVEPPARSGRRADRNKDRMSYKHLAYQIDLTQVTPADVSEANSKTKKEHELEVEVSSAELRRHGLLLKDGYANEYEGIVGGFINNVRILVRHCQSDSHVGR